MLFSRHAAKVMAAGLFAALFAVPAQCQTVTARAETAADPAASALPVTDAQGDDAAPRPESGAADPLTPAETDKAAPLAPGAPIDEPASTAATTDPIVEAVRALLTTTPKPRRKDDADDLAAITAYYEAHRHAPIWTGGAGMTENAKRVLREIAEAADWGLVPSDFELPALPEQSPAVTKLAEAELALSVAVLKYARHARGGRLEPSAVSRKFDQKPVVFEPGSVLAAIARAEAADAYLRSLHPKHPQFELLRRALIAARTAAAANGGKVPAGAVSARQIMANLERWRWLPPELGRFHVWNSVPEQMTHVYLDGRSQFSERIVVGKTSSPTPVFSADMQFVIFHPSWGVPPGMKANELAPALRNSGGGWFSSRPLASAVLRAHGLTAMRGGVPVNPDSVDWNNVDISSFHFTQPPGPTNVLGIVKFRFPNKHDVYMHDTQERHLFGGKVRAFSHGCMRVQNPVRLAEVILAHDKGWSADEVKSQLRRGADVTLSTPVPVHTTYFTVRVEEDGTVRSFADLYGLDARTASAIEGRSVTISPAAVAAAENGEQVTPPPRQSRASARRAERDARRRAAQAPKPFNPFGSAYGQ
ncbi:MAG: L,D-transpeptidase family protein [Hyphomicrobiaceae bacterium]|nr:L,D-transpeptidase family protein [Hyphomicrobiaceae bacterium]